MVFASYAAEIEADAERVVGLDQNVFGCYSWLRGVSHVCHHWRELALNTPSLWSKIRIDKSSIGAERVRAFLYRSKGVALHVSANTIADIEEEDPVLGLVASNIGRVATLNLRISTAVLKVFGESIVAPSAPFLRRLHIHAFNIPYPYVFPALLKQCTTPSLEDLLLSDVRVEWANIPPTLRSLVILQTAPSVDSFSMIVAAIAGLSALEHLTLRNALPLVPTPPTSYSPAIHLPRLLTFDVAAPAASCVQFLRHCTLPLSQDIVFTATIGLTDAEAALLVLPISAQLEVTTHTDDSVFIHLSLTHTSLSITRRHGLSRSRYFEFNESPGNLSHGSPLLYLCTRLPMHNIHSLTIGDPKSASTVRGLLSSLQNLQTVSFGTRTHRILDYSAVLSVLLRSHDNGAVLPSAALLDVDMRQLCDVLPRLQRLALEDVRFRPAGDRHDRERTFEFVESLCQIFKARQELGCPVKNLEIKRCLNMDARDVSVLKQCGVAVDWDGYGLYEFPSDE